MKRITRERQDQEWTRAELARRAGMNAATVGQIEAGRYLPYDVQLEKLARALGFHGCPDALLEEVDAQ